MTFGQIEKKTTTVELDLEAICFFMGCLVCLGTNLCDDGWVVYEYRGIISYSPYKDNQLL